MKTLRNNIWMRYLTLGLIFSLILISSSCRKIIDAEQTAYFYFINETNHEINFYKHDIYSSKVLPVTLLPKDTQRINENQPARKVVNENTYRTPYVTVDDLMIQFDGNKCLLMTRSSENTLLNIKNYVPEKLAERVYKFTYTFTEADYEKATACP